MPRPCGPARASRAERGRARTPPLFLLHSFRQPAAQAGPGRGSPPLPRLGMQRLPSSPTKVSGAVGSRGRAELHKRGGGGGGRCVTGDVRWAWRELRVPQPRPRGPLCAQGNRSCSGVCKSLRKMPAQLAPLASSPASFESHLFHKHMCAWLSR